MNVLFLDDNQCRIDRFRSDIPWAIITMTAQDTIDRLTSKSWDYVFLDHDLGGEVFVDSDREDTGMEVVRWVAKNTPEVKHFIVHSLNHSAAQEMAQKLAEAGYSVDKAGFLYLWDYQIIQKLQNERERQADV